MSRVRVRARVSGLVQGVYFRDSSRRVALQHGVDGWIRNCPDGTVEAVVEGEPAAVDAVVDYLRHGPREARVDELLLESEPVEGLAGFSIRS